MSAFFIVVQGVLGPSEPDLIRYNLWNIKDTSKNTSTIKFIVTFTMEDFGFSDPTQAYTTMTSRYQTSVSSGNFDVLWKQEAVSLGVPSSELSSEKTVSVQFGSVLVIATTDHPTAVPTFRPTCAPTGNF